MAYKFTKEDLNFNKKGILSLGQKEWMQQAVSANNNFSRNTIWIVLGFLPIPLCLIGSMLFLNESTRKAVAMASPAVGVAICGALFLVAMVAVFSVYRNRSANRNFLEAPLLVAEGKAKLHTTFNPRWGTSYYITLNETKLGIDWHDRFEEGENYRVFYCKSSDGYDFLMSFEKLV